MSEASVRVLRVALPPWPAATVAEIKARFAEELQADGGCPFSGPGTLSDVARIQMALLEEYAARDPAVARHQDRIARDLGRMLGR
ncbi:hypothetical protein ACM64Y_20345 [Novispirillum sp. DQ9]|uniref:hypothetical protein n=1 Tax=Novispirillum sp. DQ9 TaxID=3398612 RepID=UPI003C7B158E